MNAAIQRLAAAVSAAVLMSCGGGNGTTGAQLDGAIVKGPVLGTSVCAYALVNGAKGGKLNVQATAPGGVVTDGCFVTGADGGYAFTIPGYTGEVLIESNGGRFCSDENPVANGACTAGGAVVTLTEKMTAAASVQSGSRSTTYVTPLTTAAVNSAGANGGAITLESFRGRFATLAGTVAVTPSTPPTPTTHPYLSTAAKQMQAGASLQSVVSGLQGGMSSTSTTTTTSSTSSTGTPATVNAALVGVYDLVFKKGSGAGCGTLCPYTEGGSVRVEVHTNGRLVVGMLELTNPFYRSYGGTPSLHEVIWLDPVRNIEYALSDNSGANFNEINVGNAAAASNGIPAFLGQLRKPEPSTTATMTALAGTYAKAYQYAGKDAAWTSVTVAATGAVTFAGTGPNITAGQVAEIISYVNCCNYVMVKANVDISGDSKVDDDDNVRLYLNANGGLAEVGYYNGSSGIIANNIGVAVGERAALPAHDGTAVPASGNVATATLNGSAMTLTITSPQRTARQLFFNATGPNNTLLQLFIGTSTDFVAGQTYTCEGVTNSMFVTLNGNSYREDAGGRCSVTLVSYTPNGLATGKFVAELGNDRHQLFQIVNGVFRIEAPN